MPQIPVLVKTLVIFVLVIVASSRKVHLGLAATVGGLAFALWQGIPFSRIAERTVLEILAPGTLLLLFLVLAIMVVSGAMKKSGAMERFAKSVNALARSRNAALMVTPALIGTLPMPGGAAFSAPLVESLDPDRELGPDGLSAVNYWFRHVLELWWPLFPAFILTSTLSGMPVPRLVALNVYALPVLVVLGRLFVLKGRNGSRWTSEKAPGFWTVLSGFAPLICILGTYAVMALVWSFVNARLGLTSDVSAIVGRFFPILIGVGAGALYIGLGNRGKRPFRGTLNAGTLKLLGVIAGIQVFSSLLKEGGATAAAASELASAGIPTLIVAAVLPLVSGLVTGVGFGYIGLSLPIVLGLYSAGAFGTLPLEVVVVLVGACGFTGMMLSPLHVCMVVSAEHFGANLSGTLRRVAIPLVLFLAVAVVYAAILARVL